MKIESSPGGLESDKASRYKFGLVRSLHECRREKLSVYRRCRIPHLSSPAPLRWPFFPVGATLFLCPPCPPTFPSQTLPFSLCHPHPRPRDTSPLAVVIPLLMCEYQLGKKWEGQREGECGQSITVSRPEVSALNSWTLCISPLFLVSVSRR